MSIMSMTRLAILCALAITAPACGDNLTHPPDRDGATDPDGAPLTCIPDLDGEIRASELQPAIDTPIRFVVSPPGTARAVELAGKEAEGGLLWDFSTDYADDQALTVVPMTLAGKWYGPSFPEDAFVTPFNREGSLENVCLVRDDALLLLGLASSEMDPPEGRTLAVYDPPIVLLQLPLREGQSFVSTGNIVNGLVQGLPYAGRDTYEVSVDAGGAIDLPQLTFDEVLRVRTNVTVEPAVGTAVVRKQVSFYAECFAEVARATSQDGETEVDFTSAAELRRLGL
jgi:hypothetical protein